MEQLLITLEDGRQILVQGSRVITRPSRGATWGPELPTVDRAKTGTAHVPGTIHRGEY